MAIFILSMIRAALPSKWRAPWFSELDNALNQHLGSKMHTQQLAKVIRGAIFENCTERHVGFAFLRAITIKSVGT